MNDDASGSSDTNVRVTRKRVVAAKRATANGRSAKRGSSSNATSNDAVAAKRMTSTDAVIAAKRATSNDGLVAADSPARVTNDFRATPKRGARETADDAAPSLERVANELRTPERTANERPDEAAISLERVARKLRTPKRAAHERADDAATSLERVARKLRTPKRSARERADDVYVVEHEPFDLHLPARAVNIELVGGRAHYDRVIAAVMQAHTSVWIATANVKGMMVEGAARPGARRSRNSSPYVSMVSRMDELAARGVELRLLHAELPSGPFREELVAHPRLANGALELARCPRVHMKAVIVDGALLYLGSANWTGAGLGAKGSGKRNFELGVITDDAQLLDQVQALYERVWTGAECARCKLRALCPGPLDERDAKPVEAKRSRRVARLSKRA